MDIKGINSSNTPNQFSKANIVGKKEQVDNKSAYLKKTDKLDISSDAKKISGSNSNTSKIGIIKKRAEIGFYNSDAVITKVAERILNELG